MLAGRSHPYALVLAAGDGSRFGGDKLLAPFHGTPLVTHAATTVAQAISAGILAGGVAVVGPNDTRLTWHLDAAGLRIIQNPATGSGLASSLKRGLAALADPLTQPAADAAVIILADQPLLAPSVIAELVAKWREEGRSVRPRYGSPPDQPGHPVLLDRSLWPLARNLTGDQGLGHLLKGILRQSW